MLVFSSYQVWHWFSFWCLVSCPLFPVFLALQQTEQSCSLTVLFCTKLQFLALLCQPLGSQAFHWIYHVHFNLCSIQTQLKTCWILVLLEVGWSKALAHDHSNKILSTAITGWICSCLSLCWGMLIKSYLDIWSPEHYSRNPASFRCLCFP